MTESMINVVNMPTGNSNGRQESAKKLLNKTNSSSIHLITSSDKSMVSEDMRSAEFKSILEEPELVSSTRAEDPAEMTVLAPQKYYQP